MMGFDFEGRRRRPVCHRRENYTPDQRRGMRCQPASYGRHSPRRIRFRSTDLFLADLLGQHRHLRHATDWGSRIIATAIVHLGVRLFAVERLGAAFAVAIGGERTALGLRAQLGAKAIALPVIRIGFDPALGRRLVRPLLFLAPGLAAVGAGGIAIGAVFAARRRARITTAVVAAVAA